MPHNWPLGKFRLFVSHLSHYHAYASQLAGWLDGFGISSFIAHEAIEPSAEWQIEIESALSTADALVALLHPDFHTSKWCDQELGFVMGRGKPVLSVRLGADPHGFIGKYQGIPGLGRPEKEVADAIITALAGKSNSSRQIARVLAGKLSNCGWDDVRKFTKLAERIAVGGPQAGNILRAAISGNSDIRTENQLGAEAKLNTLATQWLSETD